MAYHAHTADVINKRGLVAKQEYPYLQQLLFLTSVHTIKSSYPQPQKYALPYT